MLTSHISTIVNYVQAYPVLLVLIVAWVLLIKGLALWRAAQRGEKVWFIILLVVNTLGILEVIYLLIAGKPHEGTTGE